MNASASERKRAAVEISPNLGAGVIAFGMSHAEVERALGAPSGEFKRNQFSTGVEWQYGAMGIIVSFDADGTCEALMLDAPCDPVLRGVHLLSTGAVAAMEALRRLDPDALLESDTLISHRFGLNIYAPEADDHPDWPASGVLVFRPGYYGDVES